MTNNRRRLLKILFALCALVFLVSAGMAAWTLYHQHKEDAAFATLRTETPEARTRSLEDVYDTLHNQNSDYAGWLVVEGTAIDYPVMWTPDAPEYYLRRAFDQSPSASGTPFIGEGASPESTCLIIYGHEMQNGTMFGQLDRYADPAFWQAHQPIYFYMRSEVHTYEVFAAVQTTLPAEGSSAYRYYNAAGNLDAAGYDALVQWLKTNALYDTGIVPTEGQQILLLSTCSGPSKDGRFVLAARRIS